MKLVIFGATGGVGTQLVRQAAREGHDVTVVVRDASKISASGLRVVELQFAPTAPTAPGDSAGRVAHAPERAASNARNTPEHAGSDAPHAPEHAPSDARNTAEHAASDARSTAERARTSAPDTAEHAEHAESDARKAAAGRAPSTADRLDDALRGADAVLSALGPKSRTDTGIAATGTRAVLQAMARTGVGRISVVSAAPVDGPTEHDATVDRLIAVPLLNRVFRAVYDDLRNMEDELRKSDATWTSLRPPKLTNGAHTGTYRSTIGHAVRKGRFISRADVADALLRSLHEPTFENQPVGIAY